MPKSGISGSYGSSMYRFLRYVQTVLHSKPIKFLPHKIKASLPLPTLVRAWSHLHSYLEEGDHRQDSYGFLVPNLRRLSQCWEPVWMGKIWVIIVQDSWTQRGKNWGHPHLDKFLTSPILVLKCHQEFRFLLLSPCHFKTVAFIFIIWGQLGQFYTSFLHPGC